ncbi:MAG: peptidoglycan-associated lipoprotein Pal [Thalassovita sp.]
MKHLTRAVLLTSILALAACSDPGRFGDDTVNLNGSGSASDPSSPLYFQESIGDRVFFAVDQSSLSDAAKFTLDAQADWMATNSDYTAIIEGHADEQGTREYNLALGARRANSVQEYLVLRGVSPARLKVVSYGKERPIEICSQEACYAKNRRVVTIISADYTG